MSQLKLGVEQQVLTCRTKDLTWLVVEETEFFPSKLWVFFHFSQKKKFGENLP